MESHGKRGFRQRIQEYLTPAILQILRNEEIPVEERVDGVILLMRAHGLPLEPDREKTIRNRFAECVAEQQKQKKKKRRRKKT